MSAEQRGILYLIGFGFVAASHKGIIPELATLAVGVAIQVIAWRSIPKDTTSLSELLNPK